MVTVTKLRHLHTHYTFNSLSSDKFTGLTRPTLSDPHESPISRPSSASCRISPAGTATRFTTAPRSSDPLSKLPRRPSWTTFGVASSPHQIGYPSDDDSQVESAESASQSHTAAAGTVRTETDTHTHIQTRRSEPAGVRLLGENRSESASR